MTLGPKSNSKRARASLFGGTASPDPSAANVRESVGFMLNGFFSLFISLLCGLLLLIDFANNQTTTSRAPNTHTVKLCSNISKFMPSANLVSTKWFWLLKIGAENVFFYLLIYIFCVSVLQPPNRFICLCSGWALCPNMHLLFGCGKRHRVKMPRSFGIAAI